jgi:molybdopterin converting factor small subunit
MKVRLLAFGIAKDILHARSMTYTLDKGNTIAALKAALTAEYADFQKLTSLSFAVHETYVKDSYALDENDEVVIIPPVSGG